MMRAVLIAPGVTSPNAGLATEVDFDNAREGLEDLQKLVGGYVESVPYPERTDVVCFLNEDGKSMSLPRNERATRLLNPVLRPGDWIAGNLVVCGFDPSTGENRDLPADVLEGIMTAPGVRT
jgi:hypothetical protein